VKGVFIMPGEMHHNQRQLCQVRFTWAAYRLL